MAKIEGIIQKAGKPSASLRLTIQGWFGKVPGSDSAYLLGCSKDPSSPSASCYLNSKLINISISNALNIYIQQKPLDY